MIKKLILFITLFLCADFAEAVIDVVYPSDNAVVNAPSVFLIGNTDKGSAFFINGNPVKLWEDNFFVHVVPLNLGSNQIKLKSVHAGISEEKIRTVKRIKPAVSSGGKTSSPASLQTFLAYTKTINDNSTLRENSSSRSKRLGEISSGVNLYLNAKRGDYYRIAENGDSAFWIHKSNIVEPVMTEFKTLSEIREIRHDSDEKYDYIRFCLSSPVMYTAKQTANTVELTLYGIKNEQGENPENQNHKYTVSPSGMILGYECYYEDNVLVFKIAKRPVISEGKPILKGVAVFVDPGHGGEEKGSVGPTRVAEKDINLAISKYLAEELAQSGAVVYMSRTSDKKVGLYDRVKMAKKHKTLISVSIHCNALPNGANPYEHHGCEVHYYNMNAKPLAEIIQNGLVNDLNLKNNGVRCSSFALNRSTNPVSVLIEVAYMINPEEYILLKNPEFEKKAAKSIKNSIEKYILMLNQ